MRAPVQSADPYALGAQDFEQIRKMVYEYCGVDLTGKQVLVGARLGKKIRESEFPSFKAYCEHVQREQSGESFSTMIDLLTTNHTSFFREMQHFDLLRNVILPELPHSSPISIWSAACSSGEEPYSIAFLLVDALGESAFTRTSILATDISTRVLDRAKRGLYPAAIVKQLPASILRRSLLKGSGEYADQCMVKRDVRSLIEFRQFNLLDDCSTFGPFQVIFCRNVMIYFDKETQSTLVNKLANRLVPGGYLFIGHSESLNGVEHALKYVQPATYRKSGSLQQSDSRREAGRASTKTSKGA